MRSLFYVLMGLLVACQSSFEFDVLSDEYKPEISISVLHLDQSISHHTVALHAPLSTIWEFISCEACDDRVHNPNMKLKEGDVIVQQAYQDERISINTATLDELTKLPSIGPVLAQRILEYRLNYGHFQRLEDIMLVRGIKEGIYKKIKDLIRL